MEDFKCWIRGRWNITWRKCVFEFLILLNKGLRLQSLCNQFKQRLFGLLRKMIFSPNNIQTEYYLIILNNIIEYALWRRLMLHKESFNIKYDQKRQKNNLYYAKDKVCFSTACIIVSKITKPDVYRDFQWIKSVLQHRKYLFFSLFRSNQSDMIWEQLPLCLPVQPNSKIFKKCSDLLFEIPSICW